MPRECLKIIESKSKVRQSRNKAVVAKMSTSSSTQAVSSDVAELKDMVRALILDRKNQTPASPLLRNMQNQGQNLQSQMANLTDMLSKFVTANTASTSGSGTLPGNTVTNPKEDLKGITTRSGVTIQGPKAVNHDTEVTKDTMPPANNGSTEDVQPPVVQIQTRNPNPEPNVAPVVTPVPKASIPFPSRRNDERRKEKANDQIEKFYEIFRDLSFEISFTDALMLMPKFASTLKTLIGNKEKLSELARTPLNENCSAVILNKLPKKLGDPGRFLIPCEFTGITTCNALADLGASINLMPYSVWKSLSLSELTPTCMTLELADRSITEPIGIAEDVFINVGKFQFPADFVVVDFEPDPRVPLILGRCFLKTSHALIDVYEGEITLRVGKEAITFNLDQTSKYTADYNHMTVNKIDVIDMACDEYSQEVLGFSSVVASGNPTPYFEPIVSTASPTLTPFGDSDFLLFEEADSFLAQEDDPTSSEVDPTYQDPEGDILILEAILNSEPPPPLPNHEQYMPDGISTLATAEIFEQLTLMGNMKRASKGYPRVDTPLFQTMLVQEAAPMPYDSPLLRIHSLGTDKGSLTLNELTVLCTLISKKVESLESDLKLTKQTYGVPYTKLIMKVKKLEHKVKLITARRKRRSDEDLMYETGVYDYPEGFTGPSISITTAEPVTTAGEGVSTARAIPKEVSTAEPDMDVTLAKALVDLLKSGKKKSPKPKARGISFQDLEEVARREYLFAKKDAKARLMRWILLLQEFDIEIRDTKGAENLAADHLSRLEKPHQDKLENK
ncbi:reverse transcriptase domain-containing protein [Tanacetum coccineum]|uniref:Reverse transcriptase domain-containing protein n=1 Tax=Tanacetum coccineum TaxID=301880 RepID=A0ABQ5B571_9ASTR